MSQAPTVLVVEDDQFIRNIFVDILSEMGSPSFEANNGKEALNKLKSNQIDIVISDMKMPIMDGFQLLVHLKESHPDLPVIMITGFDDQYKREDAFAAGANAYLTKPFRIKDVVQTLTQMSKWVKKE